MPSFFSQRRPLRGGINCVICAGSHPRRAAERGAGPSLPPNFMTCRFHETRRARGAIGAIHGIIQRTSFDVGSAEPCADQDCRERAQRISELERELQRAVQEVERLKAEREYYHNRVLALEQHNREVTEAATQYSLWGQSLERELAKIEPDGTRARVRNLVRKPDRHAEKRVVAPASLDRSGLVSVQLRRARS
jgi:hypothetical protein